MYSDTEDFKLAHRHSEYHLFSFLVLFSSSAATCLTH